MTNRKKLTIPRRKLQKLADVLGGRAALAEACDMSRPAVDRYFVGKGMRRETFARITQLFTIHVDNRGRSPRAPELLDDEPEHDQPTLADQGGHLYQLLVKALQRNAGVDALQAQLTRMEKRLMRIEENQRAGLGAWGLDTSRMPSEA